MKEPNRSLVPFMKALRLWGYTKDYDSVAGGPRVVQFSKRFAKYERTVDVQLWQGSTHRASHTLLGSMNTHPTSFSTVEEMEKAVIHEETRMDNNQLTRMDWPELIERRKKYE